MLDLYHIVDLPDFVSSISRDSTTFSFKLTPPYSAQHFKGHFNEVPILPGVILLSWTYQFAAIAGYACNPGKVRNLKFGSIVKPTTALTLTLQRKNNDEITFLWMSNSTKCASGILTMES